MSGAEGPPGTALGAVEASSDPIAAARETLGAALGAAGPRRHVLVADFALRLARLGHVREVSVTVAGGPEAAEAARQVLAELAPPGAPADAPGETALAGAVGAQVGRGGSDALEPLPKRNRACPECGRALRQDGRQAKRRVFCSVRCRVRHHRAQAVSGTGVRAPALQTPFGRVPTEKQAQAEVRL